MIISWDNFDYNQTVRHQTLRDPAKHTSATTGKLSIGHYIPDGKLQRSMLRLNNAVDPYDIYLAPENRDDDILHQCQRYCIAEAIRHIHREAVEALFSNGASFKSGQMREQVKLVGSPEFSLY